MVHGVIMAGGSGTRFWPESRKHKPKQFLSITGKNSMVRETFDRLNERIPADRTHVVTNVSQVDGVCEYLPELPHSNIIAEPCARNTAACIGLAALRIARNDPDATMVIVPADSYIHPAQEFVRVIDIAAEAAADRGSMVVIGIPPTFPATGYGYIHRGERVLQRGDMNVYEVRAFKEKPDAETAAGFVDSGEYYWNSGSFIWKVSTILDAFRKYMPELAQALERIEPVLGSEREDEVVAREYEKLDSVSIDYGVMEYAEDVKVVEATYTWDDVGSWQSVENLREKDAGGNVIDARHVGIDTRNSTIRGCSNHLIATVGVDDLVIVHTPDATLVCRKERAQDVKKIVEQLENQGMADLL